MDMENYRSSDGEFRIHINLTISALKYWRNLRKKEELEEDDHFHFLGFEQKEF